MRTGLFAVTFSSLVILICGCSNTDDARTQGAEPPARGAAVGTGGAGANVKTDAEFVDDVVGKTMAGIELSRIALGKSANPQVKAFAQVMINDYTTAEDKLKNDLAGHPLDWPTQPDDSRRDIADDLTKQHGPEFDRDYTNAMVELQQDLAAKLESRLDVQSLAAWKTAAAARTQSKALPDPGAAMADVQVRPTQSDSETTMKINRWAADTYVVAQKHLDTARTLENAAKNIREGESSRPR